MRKIFSAIIILFLFLNSIYSQTTFSKTYPQFGDNLKGHQVLVAPDENYIIAFYSTDALHIIKTDTLGQILWHTQITDDHLSSVKSFPIFITSDSGIVAVTSRKWDNKDNIHVVKLNGDGEVQWEFTSNGPDRYYGTSVAQTDDSGFLALGGQKVFLFDSARLIKLDPTGKFVLMKDFEIGNASLMGYCLLKLPDNKYLISGQHTLIKIDANGNEEWRNEYSYSITSINLTNDHKIIIGGSGKIETIDTDGTLEKSWNVFGSVTHICSTTDGGFAFVIGDNLFNKIDGNGNSIWEKELWGNVNYIIETGGNDFFLTGSLENQFWFIKTDAGGNFKGLQFITPAYKEKIKAFDRYVINFLSSQVNNIDIEFSSNGGSDWTEIKSDFSTAEGSCEWGVIIPAISDTCVMRMKDSADPLINTTSNIFELYYDKDNYNYIAANEIKMWIGNNGLSSHDPYTDNAGLLWPGGEGGDISAVFADGFCFGGKLNNEIRVGGSTYRYGLQAGPIISPWNAANPSDPNYKIFKAKNGWQDLPVGYLRDLYEYDYNNWPGDLGAPFNDINGDGIYTQGTDEPKIIGDETLFMVSNDLDTERTTNLYGSQPMGLEIQTTVFGFDRDDVMKDVIYKKHTVINKSGGQINDMYFTYWSDPDLGYPNDDFAGCDISLNFAYCYNGNEEDSNYGIPPALGYKLIEGPQSNKEIPGSNLPMTSFYLYICASSSYCNPPLGMYEGTLQFYNNMQGLNNDGTDRIDPVTGLVTKYCVPGDPVAGTGWYEGAGWPDGYYPGDRYFVMSSGPFNMAPGDTQNVVYAIMLARGTDRLNSVTKLKEMAQEAQDFYKSGFTTGVDDNSNDLPVTFSLNQNYPNPFNPITVISYSLPIVETPNMASLQHVTLRVFDILGREVSSLVNEEQKPGTYKVEFDGRKLSNGVYFYQLKTGNFVETKKMILLK
ncbi:MAG: T9SS type A sorting domain-containing protein [bacterium]